LNISLVSLAAALMASLDPAVDNIIKLSKVLSLKKASPYSLESTFSAHFLSIDKRFSVNFSGFNKVAAAVDYLK